jgi:hypothetical protein
MSGSITRATFPAIENGYSPMTQTLTRLYDSYDTALRAALTLKEAGFTERDVSLVSSRPAATYADDETGPAADHAGTGAAVGGIIGAATGLMVGTGVLAIPGIGPVVAAGWLASTFAIGAAGVAAGGLAGGVVGALAGTGTDEEIQLYAESIRRGDTLVTVRAPDDRVPEAARILTSFPFVDLASREAEYRAAGWQRFDETGQPYKRGRREPVLPPGLP